MDRTIAFVAVLFVALIGGLSAPAFATETGPIRSLDLLRGADLLDFALNGNRSFDLIDWDNGAPGHFQIVSGILTVDWKDSISGYFVILNDKQICTETEDGIKRCYALFKPGSHLKANGCVYVLESVYEHWYACLKPTEIQP